MIGTIKKTIENKFCDKKSTEKDTFESIMAYKVDAIKIKINKRNKNKNPEIIKIK